jgi:type IV secretion system protein VirB9
MRYYKILLLVIINFCVMSPVWAQTPLTTDSRIKTFIFNENEIYKFIINFGFQSSIEFAIGEEIETISVGDSYAWNITPVGRRLFIKPLEGNIHTNMTIITNRRTYQFEILSKKSSPKIDKELVYVVRFYYPQDNES